MPPIGMCRAALAVRSPFGCEMLSENQDRARKRYRKPITILCPDDLYGAVNAAAERELLPVSAFVRRLLDSQLRADGVLEK